MYIYHDIVGLIHFIGAILAMITGTMILVMKKGTRIHKRIGYVYVIGMTILLITAFMIYRLWSGWGLFHYAAVISSVTLLGGFLPIIFKFPKNNYIALHFSFMYWSVVGLYGAFFSEIMTRLPSILYEGPPDAFFFQLLSLTIILVMVSGGIYFYKNKERWLAEFS